MAGEMTTKTIKDTQLKQYSNNKWNNLSALEWDGTKWVDFPVLHYDGTSYTILNQGKYQTTWGATWGQSYRYLNLSEKDSRHGTKYQRVDETKCGYYRSDQFLFQGWWSKDPNGRGASLFGFNTDSIKTQLGTCQIERVELYLRNLHACQTSTLQEPMRYGHLWTHDKATKPNSIKRSIMFGNQNNFIGKYKWFRGPSLQRTDSIYRYGNKPILPNWDTGYGTGLLDWKKHANTCTVEGTGNSKKVWLVLDNNIGEKLRQGIIKGFGFFEGQSDSLGDEYGYWGSATVTPAIYLAISTGNRMVNYNKQIALVPQLRITYSKLNP